MKISKIYSNNESMTPILFNGGFNVVYGDVEDKKAGKNEHNLGKTSLVHLIDFLLLKTANKKLFLVKYKSKFMGWIFYIEIELGKDRYLTIKRSVDTPTEVSFKEHASRNQDFSALEDKKWDHNNIKLQTKKQPMR